MFPLRSLAVCPVVLCLYTASAAAERGTWDSKADGKKRPEWVLSVYSGRSSTNDSNLTIDIPGQNTRLTYRNVRWKDKSLDMPFYYGNHLNYWPSSDATIGFGLEFIHMKVYLDPDQVTQVSGTQNGNPYNEVEPIGNTLQSFNISDGINYVTFNVIGRQKLRRSERYPSGQVQPYLGIGVGVVIPHAESAISGDDQAEYETDGFSWQLFGGVEYRFTPDWGVFLQYRYTDYKASVKAAMGGTAHTRFISNHVVLGTSYRFK